MSVVDRRGVQVELPPAAADVVTVGLIRWSQPFPLKLKYVATLALHESGWTNEAIGQLFGHPRGHVSRILRRVRDLVRAEFNPGPEAPR